MIRSLANADLGAVLRAWRRFFPDMYRIDGELLHDHSVGDPTFDWGASLVDERDGEIVAAAVVKRSSALLYPGADKDTAHLSAFFFDDVEAACDLLTQVKRILTNRGLQTLVYGADAGHFFPGCPTECTRLCDFLTVQAFETGSEAIDLERDMADYAPPRPIPTDATFRVARDEDRAALETFLQREFPGRWRHDVLHAFDHERAATVFLLLEGSDVHGMALLQDGNTKKPISGGVWRNDLGAAWGALGPIGVSKSVRGRGWGDGLLSAALSELRDRGVERAIIDWTTLVEFYGAHGFVPTRRYHRRALRLTA